MNDPSPINQDALAVELLAEDHRLQVEYPGMVEDSVNDDEWLNRIKANTPPARRIR